MLKIISVKLFLLMLISGNSFAQTETFDILTFTPPKNFKKDSKQGLVTFSDINKTTGGFCIIAMYASTASSGDSKKDFENEWKELVAEPFKSEEEPKTETESTPDGWKVVTGIAPINADGVNCYIILTVASGFGKTLSIRTSLNDEAYSAKVDALFATFKLDKTAKIAVTNNPTTTVQTSGARGKFGLMMYRAPAGWSEDIYPDGVVFKPLDLPAGDLLFVQIMQPLNAGSLEQALKISHDEAAAMYKGMKMHAAGGAEYEKKEAKRSFRGWEYMRSSGGVRIENGTPYPPEYGLDLFVIKVNNRYERVAILKSRRNCKTSMSRYYPDDMPLYKNAIENLLFSIQFSDFEDPAVKPGSIKGEGIVGVWEGISMVAGAATTSNPAGLQYKVFTPIFFSNGQAYFGTKFPTEGLDEFNTWLRAENFRRDWGTWSFSNGQGVLKLPYGNLPMRMQNGKFIITANNTDHGFHKLNSVDGARFSGTYVMAERYGKTPVISFTADGKFTDKGAILALYHESDYCTNTGLMPGSGTYEVKDHSVIFSFSDGRKIKVAFMGTDYDIKNLSPSTLTMGFNDDGMRRQ